MLWFPKKISLHKTFLIYLFAITFITIISVGYPWVRSERHRFEEESDLLRTTFLETKKEIIKRETQRALAFVDYMRAQTEERLKSTIKRRVYEAHAVAMNIHAEKKSRYALDEIKKTIKDALRPIRFNKGRGYFFAFNLAGVEVLFADKPEMEGKNMMQVRGGSGELVVPDMLNLVKKQGEGFYTYLWSKPNLDGFFPKIAFVKRIAPIDWVVGTGEYLDDVKKDIQEECLQWISKISFGKDGYVFAGRWDGFVLSGPAMGKNMYDLTDENGVKIVQQLIDAAKNGGRYVRYVFPKNEGKPVAPKISYSAGVDEWQWYVGAGVYVDEIESEIAEKQSVLRHRINRTIGNILFILLFLFVAIILLVRFFSGRIHENIKSFSSFFDRTSTDDIKIDIDTLSFSEFAELARSANEMIDARKAAKAQRWKAMEILDAAISHSPAGILIADAPDGTIWLANPAAMNVRGGNRNNLTGIDMEQHSSMWHTLRPDGTPYPGNELPLSRAILNGELTRNEEIIIRNEAGEDRWVSTNAAPIRDESGKIMAGIVIFHDITERKKVEAELQHSEQRLRDLAELLPQTVFEMNSDGRIMFVNKNGLRLFGYTQNDFEQGINALDIIAHRDRERAAQNIARLLNGEAEFVGRNYIAIRKDGSTFPILVYSSVSSDDSGVVGLRGIAIDMTPQQKLAEERDRFKAQYIQAQKIEAIGRLAGGIAHDLNNMLSPILGYGELLLSSTSLTDTVRKSIEKIHGAGERAKDMVQQLLAFSRKQALEIRVLNVNTVITAFESLLKRMLREDIQLQLHLLPDLPNIRADAGQFEQVLMNLAINAQDAMPGGGLLRIETAVVDLDETDGTAYGELMPGPYVRVLITDTGHGMDEKIQSRIFEPYFTTKGLGKGTGLGLATVYGIIKQHQGNIWVDSEPGKGTAFMLFFPVSKSDELQDSRKEDDSDPLFGNETVMIAEDDDSVRELAKDILQRKGYQVLTAAGGLSCLQVLSDSKVPVDLLLTDVIMPDTNGKALYHQVKGLYPEVKVLYMSGYTDDVIVHHGVLEEGIAFIQKPFSAGLLAKQVRHVLDNQ